MKFIHFHSEQCIWKCCLENDSHFVSASICVFCALKYSFNEMHLEIMQIFSHFVHYAMAVTPPTNYPAIKKFLMNYNASSSGSNTLKKRIPGGHFNLKMPSYQYWDSHYKDKTYYVYNGNPVNTVFILKWGQHQFCIWSGREKTEMQRKQGN